MDPVSIAAVGWGISIAGWHVSPIITKVLNKCFSYLGFRSSSKLKKLETKILQLKLMLEATEASPDRGKLEQWMKDLKSAFYEAEDIFDTIDYHKIESSILYHPDDNSSVSKGGKSGFSYFRCNRNQDVGTIKTSNVPVESRRKLKATIDKIETLIDDGHKLLLLLQLPARSDVNNTSNNILRPPTMRPETTSAPPLVVFGRDRDLEMIRQMLRDTPADDEPSSSRSACYSVVGIYGIPGSGKTTLAQYVCEHEKEDIYFDSVMWIYVSQEFTVDSIFFEMLEKASGRKRDHLSNLDMLQSELETELRGKRFFLVLDDVWYNKGASDQRLDLLLSPLKVGMRGSKILVTTRTADAARALGAQNLVPISDLDEEQCLTMFMHYALHGQTISNQVVLRDYLSIGRKIAGKLGRSPLAARTVAGQLSMRLDIDFWTRTMKVDTLNETAGALWWTYQQLEESVRRCFTFCSMFPRRYVLQQDELVHLWMAQGFIETGNGMADMEDVGNNYFHVLLSISFIQTVENNTIGTSDAGGVGCGGPPHVRRSRKAYVDLCGSPHATT